MTLALRLLAPLEKQTPGPAPPSSGGSFVQILAGAVSAFCVQHGLDFDERALLEHLLDRAERASGVVESCTPTGLARELGLGPSGRRTLTTRLDRLVGVGAIEWDPGYGTDAGRIDVLVHHQLVRAGRGDHRVGYVQVVPAAVAAVAARHCLSASARAVLRRLLVDVDHRSRSTTGSVRQLTARYRIGRDRLAAAIDELVAAGLVRRLPDGLSLSAYDQLVRAATAPTEPRQPRPIRAGAAPESRGPRDENARPSSLPDTRRKDLTLPAEEVSLPSPVTEGEGPQSLTSWELVAARLPPHHRGQVLVDVDQAGGRRLARRRLAELAELVGRDTAVDQATADWPLDVMWPVGFLLRRLERRVADAREGALALEQIELTDAERRSAAAAATAAAVVAAAALHRRQEWEEARRQGVDFARHGMRREALAELHGGDAEILTAAIVGYDAGQAARDGGVERARAGGDRFGLSDDYDGELLWAAQAGYDAARAGTPDASPARWADSAGDGPSAARAALRHRQADDEPEGASLDTTPALCRGDAVGGDSGDVVRAGPPRRWRQHVGCPEPVRASLGALMEQLGTNADPGRTSRAGGEP